MWLWLVMLFCTAGGSFGFTWTFHSTSPLTKITINSNITDVYVGGRNVLLHLNANLTLIENPLILGPVNSSQACKPHDPKCKSLKETTNDVEVLLWYSVLNRILLCGSAHQGLCQFHDPENINKFWRLEESSEESRFGSKNSTIVVPFFNKSINDKCSPVLFVGQSYDGRDTEYFFTEFSFLKFNNYTSENGKYVNKFDLLTKYSKFGHCDDVNIRQKTEFRFIYGFQSCHHVYSIFVKSKIVENETVYETKLSRFCKQDKYMRSYMDMSIDCNDYNIVTAAHFDQKNLYLTFGVGSWSSYADVNMGSKVCKYSLKNITDKFYASYHKCYIGKGYSPPSWSEKSCNVLKSCPSNLTEFNNGFKDLVNDCHGDEICPTDKDSEKSFCGSLALKGIEGHPDVKLNNGDLIYESNVGDRTLLTAIFLHESPIIDQPGKNEVLFLGTHDGYILKLQPGRHLMRKVAKYDVSSNRSVQVEPDLAFDEKKKHVYLLTGKKVTKLSLDSCRLHTDCGDCVTSKDALGCGWCRDRCLRQVECNSIVWYNNSCPPFIHQVYPITGPIQGNTTLTIDGDNFGTKTANSSSVKVGDLPCKILKRNNTRITCITTKSNSSTSALVRVNVTDTNKSVSRKYDIRGESEISEIKFSYKNTYLISFSPQRGPIHGNTLITIHGQNLNIGKEREITMFGFHCAELWSNGTSIICQTSQWVRPVRGNIWHNNTEECLGIGNLEMKLDGSMNMLSSFCYMEDPIFSHAEPKKSIISGGLKINVAGNHFDAVSSYKMKITFPKINVTKIQDCEIDENTTTQITCYSPEFHHMTLPTNLTFPLIGQMVLSLDDDLFYWNNSMGPKPVEFKVYPDPVFENLEVTTIKQVQLNEKLLDLKGKNLNLGLRPQDIDITVQGLHCPVILLKETILHCNISDILEKYPSINEILEVTVKTGNLIQNIGRIEFSYLKQDHGSNLITYLAVIGVCLGLIILISFCLRLNHIGPFQRKVQQFNVEPSVSFHAVAGPMEVTPFLGLVERSNNNEQQEASQNVYTGDRWNTRDQDGAAASDISNIDDTIHVLEKQNLLVNGDCLRLGEDVGRGNFGCVYKGYLTRPEERGETVVAVKTILRTGSIDVNSFLTEALIMKDFNHPNVLSLIGISINKGEFPMIIVPFMANGSLLTYIRDERNAPTVRDLVKLGLDIANGMEYFNSIKFIHRDLAARNCMLDADLNVKVADFGLSRDVYSKEYYSSDNKQKLPVKWMAPESLEKGNYSFKSDVWSFGVVLWELMTRGAFPYPEVDNWDMQRYLQLGRRLPRPEYCPVSMYDTMQRCWRDDPGLRPTFKELREAIESILDTKSHMNNTEVDLGKCTIYHYTEQTVKHTIQPQFSTTSEDAALLPQTE